MLMMEIPKITWITWMMTGGQPHGLERIGNLFNWPDIYSEFWNVWDTVQLRTQTVLVGDVYSQSQTIRFRPLSVFGSIQKKCDEIWLCPTRDAPVSDPLHP